MTKLLPYQAEDLTQILEQERTLLAWDMGLGKAQPLESLLLTPTGWMLMRSAKVGDLLIGSNGQVIEITGVFPQGKMDVFEITLTDGSKARCTDDHLWLTISASQKHKGRLGKVRPLSEIRQSLRGKNGNLNHYLPIIKPVQFPTQDLPIDPYLVGYLLANGCVTSGSSIKVSIPDEETVIRLRPLLPQGLALRKASTNPQSVDYSISKTKSSCLPNGLLDLMRDWGIQGCYSFEKFIPIKYLLADPKQRQTLLCGLMDGDGSVRVKDNHLEYTTTSETLADQFVALVQSLGGIVRRKEKNSWFTYKGERKNGRLAYILSIALPNDIKPFRLSRKANVYKPREKYPPSRGIVSVRFVGKKQCQCISVSAEDQLYVTNGHILTHNTIESWAAVRAWNEFPVCIVCPKGLKRQWQREAYAHFKIKSTILYGLKPSRKKLRGKKVLIVNYEILPKWLPRLRELGIKVVVGDEIQRISNMATRSYDSFRRLCKGVSKIIACSGTPLTNRAWEMFAISHILWPKVFDSPFSFGHKFCDSGDVAFGKWRFTGSKNLKELHELLLKCGMIRRRKEEVLTQLPPLRKTVLPIELDDFKEYQEAEKDLIKWVAKAFGVDAAMRAAKAERYTRFSYLKRLVAKLKMPWVLEWLETFRTENTGKMIVGAVHRKQTPIIPMMYERFKDVSVQIHGGMTQVQRANAEDRFRKDPKVRFLFGQIQAAGVGLNLPEASTAAVVEYPWTPGACKQFITRAHRLTSRFPVNAYFLTAVNTIEEDLCRIIQRKERILDQVLDGVDRQDSSLTLMDELTQALMERKK